ncbi:MULTISPECIES: hypothetical protein [Butyricimonas]|uniref:hypothetical protein n=1 Tax=Butyricimonas TaxID=574697 RepID=UPI0007FB37BD|nr:MULTISPECIES: hypothetical protein [Butyricimonas]
MECIEQPDKNAEGVLNSIIDNLPNVVNIPHTRKSYKVKWLKGITTRKITRVLREDGNDDKISAKVAAAIVLNDYWKLLFFWWLTWRWFYYVKQYDESQLMPLIVEGKKKVQQEQFYGNIMLAIGMRDTIMAMKKEEVERFLREPRGERATL